MRAVMLLSMCLVAACSEAPQEKKEEGPVAASLGAGQWESSFETTAFRSTDGKTPALKAAVGDKVTGTSCVAAGEETKPAPTLFVGEGYDCAYTGASVMRDGRINSQLSCTHEDLSGPINMIVSGNSTADSLVAEVEINSYLPGDGDFAMSRKVTARRTGPTCQAPATKAA
jgi:Protein of unknown function (DUF3617)